MESVKDSSKSGYPLEEQSDNSTDGSDEVVVEDADFSETDKPIAGGLTPPKIGEIEKARERIRGVIAVTLLALIGVLALAAFVVAAAKMLGIQDVKDLLAVTLVPMIGLFGPICGFYFGVVARR